MNPSRTQSPQETETSDPSHVTDLKSSNGVANLRDEDDVLMYEIQGGSQFAFEQLMKRHQNSLCHFFYRHLRDWQLAEDLTQETLIRVFNTAWDYLPRGCFKGWMFRIARNLMIDSTRRRTHDALVNAGRSQRLRDEDDDVLERLAGDFVLPEDRADQNEFAGIVGSLLPKIPEEQRATFLMHHYSGLSLPEVADAMEASLSTTKSRLRLAREKLQALLAQQGIVDPTGSNTTKEESGE